MNFYKVNNHFDFVELSFELFTFTNKYVFHILTYYPKMKSLCLSQNITFKTYLTISGSQPSHITKCIQFDFRCLHSL